MTSSLGPLAVSLSWDDSWAWSSDTLGADEAGSSGTASFGWYSSTSGRTWSNAAVLDIDTRGVSESGKM